MKNAKDITPNGEKLCEMSRLPPLRYPDEDLFDQYSQSDMTSTAELRKLSMEATNERTKFPVTPLPIRIGEETSNETGNMRITDTLSSTFLIHDSSNSADSNDGHNVVSRTTPRYSSDPTVDSKTTFASCIVEVGDDLPVKSDSP